jgi:hypothetical protein
MSTLLRILIIGLLPSVPLICIFLAFSSVLKSKKFEMRMLLMRGESLTKYLSAYGKQQQLAIPELGTEEARFSFVKGIVDKIFWLQYSGWEYGYALFFNLFCTFLLTTLAVASAAIPIGLPAGLADYLSKSADVKHIVAGGLGALLWSIYEFAERYRSGDLAPDSIFAMGARLLIVSAVGAFVGAAANDHLALPLAFAVGVLPISSVRTFFLNKAFKAMNIASTPGIKENPAFSSLQGWNEDVCDKLKRAGISSVEQLACINPFQVFLRSNLDWRVILDLCDQALLAIYLGDKAEKLRSLGFRSAGELAEIEWYKDDADYFSDFTHTEAIKEIASALSMSDIQVRMLIQTLSQDITVSLISTLWLDDTPGEHHS